MIFIVCQGDSGGPLTAMNEDGNAILVGVISFGHDCKSTIPALFSFVPAFRDWIKTIAGI